MSARTVRRRNRAIRGTGRRLGMAAPVIWMAGGTRRRLLLAGASVLAMMLASPRSYAIDVGSRAAGVTAAPNVASDAALAAARQAQQAAQDATQSMKRATTALQSMQSIQAAARAAAQAQQTSTTAPVAVPNGLGVGGLNPNMAAGWSGANAPTQAAGTNNVNIRQTQAQAILNWKTFNVGAKTTLTYDQQGNANWVALNRVDATTGPSQILGAIKADGQVYVINQSGIIFGGASQINVGSLIASTAGITDAQFKANGIYSAKLADLYRPSFTGAGGKVVVESGAQISTNAPKSVTSGGGFVMLLGTEVDNAGSITTPKGQTLLAAGDDFILRPGFGTTTNATSTTRGSEVAPVLHAGGSSGMVNNTGVVFSQQGDITLAGHAIVQDGILVSTTSVSQRGTIHLLNSASDATGSVTLTGNAATLILPELESTDTALNSQRDALIADSAKQNSNRFSASIPQFDNLSLLADREDQSRIEIVTGGLLDFKPGSLTMAQGGQISAFSMQQVLVEASAMLDVSGVRGVALAMSSNAVKVNIQGNELRDSPQNRDSGKLLNDNAWIDLRSLIFVPAGTGGYASDRYYTSGGLLEVSGYVNNTAHTIGEWSAVGGTITVSGQQVVAQKGATFNISGGSLDYQGGWLQQSALLGSDGRIYDIGNAPSDLTYKTVVDGFVVDHSRAGITEVYDNALGGFKGARWEDGYTVGRDAGVLRLYAVKSDFKASIDAEVVNGQRQTNARPSSAIDGYKLGQTQVALPGQLVLAAFDVSNGSVVATGPVVFADPAKAPVTSPWNVFDATALNAFGLGGLTLNGGADVQADLTFAPGARVVLNVSHLGGNLTARGGSINLTASLIDPGVTIDTRGLWTNAVLDPTHLSGLAYRDGGAISITGDITAGVRVDASAGGAILANGKFSGGNGGDISLTGTLKLDGEVVSNGFGRGGKLSLYSASAVVVGQSSLTNGILPAGEASPLVLSLASPVTLAAGTIAPFPVTITVNSIQGGQPMPVNAAPLPYQPIRVGSAGWTVPTGFFVQDSNSGGYYPGMVVPPGTTLNGIFGRFGSGYVLPPNSFTSPLAISAVNIKVAAGNVLPYDAPLAKGYVLPVGAVLPQTAQVNPVLALDPSFFQKGFSSYNITGALGITVQPGQQIDVVEPVYQYSAALRDLPTGGNIGRVAPLVLAPLFTEDARTRTLTQRPGADLVLQAPAGSLTAPITIGAGAAITVDPGRSVSLSTADQITIEGRITAHGGSISAINLAKWVPLSSTDPYVANGRSVWIGSDAVLDVSGVAYAATDTRGGRYGTVTDGGSIVLGSNATPQIDGLLSGSAFVVIRPGARLEASGTSAVLDVLGERPTEVASNGGSISLASEWGFAIDGTMRAAAGGAKASGGSLSLTLESPVIYYGTDVSPADIPQAVTAGRIITITQEATQSGLAANLAPGAADPAMVLGSGRISVAQIRAGGFDSLSLWGRNAILFDGNVDLSLGRSLVLQQGNIVNTSATGRVTLSAPYVLFDGHTRQGNRSDGLLAVLADRLPAFPSGAAFSVAADLIDVRNQAYMAYGKVSLASSGDIRFLTATDRPSSAASTLMTVLAADGDLDLTAGQIYPASGAVAMAAAGTIAQATDGSSGYLRFNAAGSRLTVRGTGARPDLPFSVFGSLTLLADTIEQGGIVRAPMGQIQLGDIGSIGGKAVQTTSRIELLPGSITSVSAQGLIMPYGGTADGVTYAVDSGAPVTPTLVNGQYSRPGSYVTPLYLGVGLTGTSIQTDAGSQVDLSGGGTLTGAAFVTGRGGSVDPLLTPLANAGIHGFSNSSNKVYAIVPGVVTAPVPGGYTSAWSGAAPSIGQQITIPAGVPGLPAGTYTLLPANYALLPGAFRVEVGGRSDQALSPVAVSDGSYVLTGHQGVAYTNIQDALATRLIVTPAAAVRRYGQFNEQSYANFVLSNAAQFGTRRTMLEADAKNLLIDLAPSAMVAPSSALKVNGAIDFTGVSGGLDGSLFLTSKGDLVITRPGSATVNTATLTTVGADALADIGAPNMVLGARPADRGTFVDVDHSIDVVDTLTLESGVLVSGAQVIGFAGNIDLKSGAVINTLGHGFAGLDSRSGLAFGAAPSSFPGLYAMLVVSNGNIILNGSAALGTSGIVMEDGSALYSEGTVGFYAPTGLQTAGSIKLGTRNLALSVTSFNIGSAAALAAVPTLPAGLRFDQSFLDMLLSGGGVAGVPAVERLTMTASQSINFFGSSDLSTFDPVSGKSRLEELVLASPAIYGYGTASDKVHIATNRLVWSGGKVFDAVATGSSNQPQFKSATPPERLSGLGNGGGFLVDAREVVFGYPAQAQPDANLVFNRLMLGFDRAVFNATERVTANNKGTVSVYASGAAIGTSFDPSTYQGVGGSLTFNTPLVTGEAGGNLAIYGGAVTFASTGTAAGAAGGLGATLAVRADTLRVDTHVLLSGGALTLTARQNLLIDSGARLDLSGHAVSIGKTVRQVWGGDVTLVSQSGDVNLAAGSAVDLSSDGSDAGTLKVRAGGAARFAGSMLAHGGGNGARDGAFDLTSASLGGGDLSGGFAALNEILNASGFTYSRAFAFGSGNLVVGNDVKARNVAITVDGGSLTVDGRIDASGLRSGAIRLSARDDLVLTGNTVLDVRGTHLVVDSYGQPIEASNRNTIEIGTSQGWIRLGQGATLDTSSPDAVARGRVEINARRSSETGGDVNIDASAPLNLRGIASLAVNGTWTYSPTDAAGTIVQDTTGQGVPAGAVGLAQIDGSNQIFYGNALGNAALQGRLAGLKGAGDAYHVRPGVEIVSSAASGGKLTVVGDLDLSGYRYGSAADRDPASPTYGRGEPLALSIRAAGDLTVKGSITDGFGIPKSSPDESGFRDRPQNNISVVIPGYVAPYDDYVPDQDLTLAADWVLPYYYYDGTTSLYVSDNFGNYYHSGDTIPAGTKIAFTGDSYFYFGSSQYVPDGLDVTHLPQAKIYAIAPMLTPGAMSASIRLVGGADLASADPRKLLTADRLGGAGNIVLDDFHVHHGPIFDTQIASVIRTGTGDLDILAGGSLTQRSLYAIYTAGTQRDLASGNDAFIVKQPLIQLRSGSGLENTFNDRASYFPGGGGDLRVTVQGNLAGYNTARSLMSDGGDWLTLQGAPELSQSAAWSVNFGNYKINGNTLEYVSGPLGFGTFGGGNATVLVGGDAGGIGQVNTYASYAVTTGLSVTVASTGRVLADGTLVQTGGGDVDVRVGGRLNPLSSGGQITDLRGSVMMQAAEFGAIGKIYATAFTGDPRPAEFGSSSALAYAVNGPNLLLGDAAASMRTRGTAQLGAVGDPGLNALAQNPNGNVASPSRADTGVQSWYSLWQPSTALDVVSLGGDLGPFFSPSGLTYLPPVFTAATLSGNVYAMQISFGGGIVGTNYEQAPAPRAQFELLAAGSIYGYTTVKMSAADPALLPTPFHPAFIERSRYGVVLTNASSSGLFAFAPDQPTTDLHAEDPEPVRIYAVAGDIVGLSFASAKKIDMAAGRDIVMTKDSLSFSSGLSITHAEATDVSTVSAGGQIIYPRISVNGPGDVSIMAGGDIFLGSLGAIVSNGPAYLADSRLGASISLAAGVGRDGPDYAALAALYLDPANRAVSGKPLADQPGKVAKTYEAELREWLAKRYNYVATDDADARGYFHRLAPEQKDIFLNQVYAAELKASGREYNDASSSRYRSYVRGREAIATLFPKQDYDGNIIMYGGAGIRTLGGGDITMLTPGGRQVIGVEGVVPPAEAGLVTQGQGDINLYAKDSILLGLSRVMTTFGGGIMAWSAEGDINAGRGSKTTQIYTPPKRIYDVYGNVRLSPQAPSTGAGIATLNPIPQVKAGDIDLIAPLGTIDAGEAGIRVSGNINLAALQIVNAANIQVQGTSAGIPTVQGPPVAALATASNATAATQQAATPAPSSNSQPSVIIVEIVGYGGSGGEGPGETDDKKRGSDGRQGYNAAPAIGGYNDRSAVQIAGYGVLSRAEAQLLTPEERENLVKP